MALEVSVKAAAGAPVVIGDCMITIPFFFFFFLITHFWALMGSLFVLIWVSLMFQVHFHKGPS